ncbi:hypothetical protein [Georgenia sp. SYP-B2076]|uniref:hypothetical protein n=1 Tax=Georgenia sp. SYP-B2076 TaxID=2495881 RepID=UPI000F8CCEB4|nr:hypothetical protein [Georgenia sp. SYP-B2076]
MYITAKVCHPGEYAHWQGATYRAAGLLSGVVQLFARQDDSPGAGWRREVDRQGRTEFTRRVPLDEVDSWIAVSVDATWEGLEFGIMRVDPDGMAGGYLDDRCTSAHAAIAERQGGTLERVDRGEVHLRVPLRYLEDLRERVSDMKASALKRLSPEWIAEQARAAEQARIDRETAVARAAAEQEQRRQEALNAIADSLEDDLAPGWSAARVETTLVGYDRRVNLLVTRGDDERPEPPPHDLLPLLQDLRHVDRRSDGEGTWLSATLAVERGSTRVVEENRHAEPSVQPPISAADYDAEQLFQQRSHPHLPGWWQEKLGR